MKRLPASRRACPVCGKSPTRRGHWYMLADKVWYEAGLKNHEIACIDCVASRIGRPLRTRDFTDCNLNYGQFGWGDIEYAHRAFKSLIAKGIIVVDGLPLPHDTRDMKPVMRPTRKQIEDRMSRYNLVLNDITGVISGDFWIQARD